jgi:ethanolamine utilization microcompartment shell protein EutS
MRTWSLGFPERSLVKFASDNQVGSINVVTISSGCNSVVSVDATLKISSINPKFLCTPAAKTNSRRQPGKSAPLVV